MKKIFFFLIVYIVLIVHCGLSHAWEYRFFGINPSDFKGRKVTHILLGAVTSLAVHEAGHYTMGLIFNADPSVKWIGHRPIMWAYDLDSLNDTQKQLYYGGGFISQALIGTLLTIAGNTRHSDFTLGFNSFTMVNSAVYVITGGLENQYSDIQNLDNGEFWGITSSVYSGILSYVNLKRERQKGIPYFEWTPYRERN